jgi:hypothetical protein
LSGAACPFCRRRRGNLGTLPHNLFPLREAPHYLSVKFLDFPYSYIAIMMYI